MVTIAANLQPNGDVTAGLHYEVDSPAQFEEEVEGLMWNAVMYLEQHSESSCAEILRTMLAELDDEGHAPFATVEENAYGQD